MKKKVRYTKNYTKLVRLLVILRNCINQSFKGLGGKHFVHNLILFYIVLTKLQDAFYRF